MLSKNKIMLNLRFLDIVFLIFCLIGLYVVSYIQKYLFQENTVIILATLLVILVLIEIYRRLSKYIKFEIENKAKEMLSTQRKEMNKLSGEVLVGSLGLILPPIFNKWSLDGDLIKTILEEIVKNNRINILELGSGNSTIIISRVLKILGKGKLYSVEHDNKYYEITRNLINMNNLDEFVDLILAPLKKIEILGKEWLWYDTQFLNNINPNLDLLIIDGPPGNIQYLSRFPALPILLCKFKSNFVIFLDDGNRSDEKEIIKRWKEIYPKLRYFYIHTSKGAWRIEGS